MAALNFQSFASPVSEAEPCGPDLDLANDADFMNFVARAEGFLPTAFFVRDAEGRPSVFDRSSIDFEAEYEILGRLLARTRDIRLLVILAKLLVLNRDLGNFAACLDAIARLIAERWEDVHPHGEDGDFTARMVVLQTLDDLPTVVLPLQHMPITVSRKLGPVSCRSHMLATGKIKPREGEETPDPTAVEAALDEVDLPGLIAGRDQIQTVEAAIGRIRTTFLEHVGFSEAVSFDQIAPLVDHMFGWLDTAVGRRDASARRQGTAAAGAEGPGAAEAPVDAGAAGAAAPGAIASVPDAIEALAAARAYFSRCEPSSPAVLLIRQAEQLVGKSFLEVMQILIPAHADQATIAIGSDQVFELPIERLSALSSEDPPSAEDSTQDRLGDDSESGLETAAVANPAPDQSLTRIRTAATRREAIALLEQIGRYFRAVEPSSPIPLLTERACGIAQRDFLNLLRDFLPGVGVRPSEEE